MNRPRISWSAIGSLIFATTLVGRADTIKLISGQEVKATVTKYRNHAFEVRMEDGKSASYPSNNVKRIQFDPRESPSKLVTRTNGAQEGTVTAFENGAFNLTQASGTRAFSAIFVEQAEFVADRGQSVEVISHGQQIDISKHLALGNVTIVDFYADWCGPCRMMAPALDRLAGEYAGRVTVGKLDVDVNQDIAIRYSVMAMPTLGLFRGGKLVDRLVGYPGSAAPIRAWIDKNVPAEIASVPAENTPPAPAEAKPTA